MNIMKKNEFFTKLSLYTICNLGTKLLAFLIVPYYTYVLSTEDFGYYDLLNVTTGLLTPLITLQTNEAVLKGCIDEKYDNLKIVKASATIALTNSCIFTIFFIILNIWFPIYCGGYYFVSLILLSIMGVIQQYSRALSNYKLYAISGTFYTFIFLISNVVNLSFLNTGIKGLFISSSIAAMFTIFLILLCLPEIRHSIFIKLDTSYLKWIVKYSLPLIPNTTCWWVISASDRYLIKIFLGNSANGIYAVSCRFALIISTLTNLVNLAWQEYSLKEYEHDKNSQLFSYAFNIYMKLLLCASSISMCIIRPFIDIFIQTEYSSSWNYIVYLFLGTIFMSLASFLNTSYLAEGKTINILQGTLLAGIVNILFDLFLIRYIGIYAAAISTMLSGITLLLIRISDNKKYLRFQVEWKSMTILVLLNFCVALGVTRFISALPIMFMFSIFVSIIFCSPFLKDYISKFKRR